MKKLFGVTVAMTTPFLEDKGIDYEAAALHTEFLISKGVHCLYPCGTTGEMLRMTLGERKKIAEVIVNAARGRLPVYIQCGAASEQDTIELVRHAEAIGADGVGVVTPQFFGLKDQEMIAHYVAVANSVSENFPVYLYNIPQCAANDITVAQIEGILEKTRNVIGIKYSYPDIDRTLDYLSINNWQFSVMHGNDRVLVAMKALGCDGTVSGISSVFPEPFVRVYEAICENKWEEAKKHQQDGAKVADILRSGGLAGFKAALNLRGIRAGHMRRPLMDLPGESLSGLQEKLESFCADANITLRADRGA